MTISELIRSFINHGVVQPRPTADFHEFSTQLRRIGNNLNQITAKINAGIFRSYNFQEVVALQRAIYAEVRRIGRGD